MREPPSECLIEGMSVGENTHFSSATHSTMRHEVVVTKMARINDVKNKHDGFRDTTQISLADSSRRAITASAIHRHSFGAKYIAVKNALGCAHATRCQEQR